MLTHPAIRRLVYQIMAKQFTYNEFNLATFQRDYIAKELFSSGLYEKNLLQKLREYFALDDRGGTVIDVGANIGNHTVYFSKLFEQVVAFEPNPACYFLIQANILANGCKNVTAVNKAVSSTIGNAKLSFDYKHTGGGTIEPAEVNETSESIEVETVTLDSLLDQIGNVTCLKIDAEGHEAEIINGAKKLLDRESPLVVFEAHDLNTLKNTSEALRQSGYNYFYDIIQSRRYSQYRIINMFNYLFYPNTAKVTEIDFTSHKGYQMVAATKSRQSG